MTRDLLLGVEIGLPSPYGFIPIIPKYVPCREGQWSRPGARYCRVIESYGPRGVARAISRSELRLTYDPFYLASMPYIRLSDVATYVSPRDALEKALSGASPLYEDLVKSLNLIARAVGSSEFLGLTGSLAMGIEQAFSDIDIVVYGSQGAQAAFELYVTSSRQVEQQESMGGVYIKGFAALNWRRGLIGDVEVPVSWVGVPEYGVATFCKPLNDYLHIKPPLLNYKGTLSIPPGQEGALLYPPCVTTEEGVTVVSFEYNLGGYLYGGGEVEVEGVASSDSKVVYVGTRERPGGLTLRAKFKS
ncbi:hypothetical protein [Acidilobus sp. 7A]|jgi:predicted nucleotidyltransferase|uniref:hypothetical protein n=1 Tax=Acidilobus sp. 7A TaxID=1577685 RepID=UPI000764E1C2|nr:hypothetical protein [Acidilobus sp. 7A]AMD30374.1 hypothetical protein SE86_02045 [Acidilobus sp. 7A]